MSPFAHRISLIVAIAILTPQGLRADWWSNFMDAVNNIPTQTPTTYSTSGYSAEQSSSTLSENKARAYIDQIVQSLDHALRPTMKINKVNLFCKRVHREVLECRSCYSWTPYGKRYKKDMIDQFISSAILELIEESAYDYAYKKSGDSSIARRISESMRNNALARIMQNGTLNFERLTEFVGTALKRAVSDAMNRIDAPYNTTYNNSYNRPKPSAPSYEAVYYAAPAYSSERHYEFDVYPSDDCCCCLDSFDTVARIFIKPCGHDICKSCAKQWFFGGGNRSCPQCRAVVDRDYISVAIAS
jgi:hypothetical protein